MAAPIPRLAPVTRTTCAIRGRPPGSSLLAKASVQHQARGPRRTIKRKGTHGTLDFSNSKPVDRPRPPGGHRYGGLLVGRSLHGWTVRLWLPPVHRPVVLRRVGHRPAGPTPVLRPAFLADLPRVPRWTWLSAWLVRQHA